MQKCANSEVQRKLTGSKFRNKFVTLLMATVLALSAISLTSCSGSGSDAPAQTGPLHLASLSGENVTGNSYAKVDMSETSKGYVGVKYLGNSSKVKLQIKCSGQTYTYDIDKIDEYMIFPFSCGDGTYSLEVYENVSGNQYAMVYACSISVSLEDENLPFLYPNTYVYYSSEKDSVVSLTGKVISGDETQLEIVQDVYDYAVKKIDYDYEMAASVSSGYVPDLDQVIDRGKGICFDYASLMTAMLRISNIPTKLVIGYRGNDYHAWISVYISDIGWVDNVIEFDGKDWTLMDPATVSSGGSAAADYVEHQDKYHALYFY